MKKNLMTRIFKGALALLLAFSVVETSAFTKVSALDVVPDSKVADTDTSEEWRNHFINNTQTAGTVSTGNAGYVWSDKTVLTSPNAVLEAEGVQLSDDGNFLVELSAVSANREVVGYSTIPTDTMLVLDLSNSMTEDNMYAMVKAVNAAMDKLLKLNNENRVGIAVYDTDASVLLPLDRYTTTSINNNETNYDTSDDYPEYIELVDFNRSNNGANTGTIKTIYSGLDWAEIETTLKNASNSNRDDLLEDYFDQYRPWGQSVNWKNIRDNKPSGQTWETYLKSELPKRGVNIPADEALVKDGEGNDAKYSVSIGGGTYMQAGMWQAWKQFESITDTVVENGILAGTKRMPVMVLMTDGAPTYNTTYYNNVNVNSYNSGDGYASSANNRNGFITQLTASWSKEKMAAHYDNTALFYTLGLGVGDNTIAQSVLNPNVSTDTIDGYWESYLAAKNGATVKIQEGNNSINVTRDTTVKTKDYVNKYFGANDADGLINAFNEIVSEIVLQSKYYPTLAESKNYNMDGFMTFTDVIGEYMEVKDIKGLIAGTGTARKLYSGSAFAKAFINDDIFGDVAGGDMNKLDDDGKLMIKVIQNRLGCTEDQAKEALRYAITQGHVSYTSDSSYSNYMCWFADTNGKFVAVWNGDEDATNAGATYRVKDYGFYGTVGSDATFNLTDMAYIVVQVLENIATGQQTVVWKVPASLIPVIEYEVSFDGNSYENATNIKMNVVEAEPLRLVYELGVQADINEYNISEKVDSDYKFIDADKNYTFYTNFFNYDEVNKKTGADTDNATEMVFEPSLENERYYYTKDTYVLNANGQKVKSIDDGQKYYYEVVHFNKKSDGTVDLIRWNSEISASKLEDVQTDEDGYAYLSKGTAFNRLAASGTTEKYGAGSVEANVTDSLGYFNYPVICDEDEYSSKTYLGNNGRITIEPMTGIKLSKVIANVAANTNTLFDFVIDVKDETGAAITKELEVARFHKDGTAYDVYGVTPSNGKITVTLLEGEYAYVMDLPEGAVYTITEKYNEDYSLKIATVNGLTQSLNAPYDATGTTKNNVFDNVVFENALTVEGTLTVEKEVEYPFDVNAQVAANKEFTILVDLGAKYAGRNIELVGGKTVAANANGVVVVVLKDGESVTFVLDEGDGYVVTETNLPAGFTMNTTSSVNLSGSVTKDGITATVVNTYQPEKVNPVNVTVDGTKELTGRDWLVSDQFQYLLQSFDGSVWNTITVVNGDKDTVNKDDKTFNFNNTVGAIELTEVGTYYYRVIEVNGGNTISGVTYDNTVYNFNIVVTDADLDGKLEIADVTSPNATVTKENDTYGVSVSFTNTYAPSGNAEIVLNINKEITNNTTTTIGKDGYTFELYDNNGRLVATSDATTNEGNTSIELVFNVDSLGEHAYVLKEVVPADPLTGMIYDTTAHNIVVKVFDNLDGTLATQVKVDNGNFVVSDNAEINFNNIYDEETHVITGNKVLIGREWQEGDSFSFRLYKTGADFKENATSAQLIDTQVVDFNNATKGFSFDAITYYEPGTHYYVIKEVAGSNESIKYDEQEYYVTVTLTRDANAQLIKEVTIVNANGETVDNITFTNEYLIEATVKKVWDDAQNQDGKRPTELKVTLSDGTEVTLSEKNSWTATVKDLPVYDDDGNKIEYTWTEENVAGYTLTNTSVNGTVTILTNTHTPEETTATVVKVWNDNENQDGIRPAELKVTLSDGTEVTLSEANDWSATVTNLPKYEDGEEIVYTWTEERLPEGYKLTDTSVNGTITTLTNTHTPEETTATVKKVWNDLNDKDGKRPTELNVTLSDGTEVTLNAGNGWTAIVTNLPKYKDGKEIIYTWTENSLPEGYTLTDTSVNGTITTLTNTYVVPVDVEFSGNKVLSNREWNDDDSFSFELYQTGSDFDETATGAQLVDTKVVDFASATKAFTFDEITYDTVGTYYYVIKEVNGGATIIGVTYDAQEYHVTVTVTADENGQLDKEVVMVNEKGESVSTATFTNTYKVTPAYVTFDVVKELSGRDWKDSDEFTFELYEERYTDEGYREEVLIQTVKATSDNRNPSFAAVEIKTAGIYNYIVKETNGGQTIDGVYYSDEVYTMTVHVVDDGEGLLWLSYDIINPEGEMFEDAVFVNTYKADKVTAKAIVGTKTMVDMDMRAGKFTFNLYQADENYRINSSEPIKTTTNVTGQPNEVTDFAFDAITYETAGTYYYVVTEQNGGNTIEGITYDNRAYKVNVVVVDNFDGTMTATVNYVDGPVAFRNTYKVNPTSLTLGVEKEFTGREWTKDDVFAFELYETTESYEVAANATPMQTIEASNVNRTPSFENIEITSEGTRYFVIKEVHGGERINGVNYSSKVYRVRINAMDNGDGTLTTGYSIVNNDGIEVPNATFVNTYKADEVNIPLGGYKTMHGRDMKADEFTFELYYADENGNPYDDYPYDTVTNISGLDGVATKFEFTSTLSYTKPTKAYVLIVEKAGNLGGVTYDSREYVVEITVTDNLEGKLEAEITSIVDKNGKQYDAVYFDNYYKAAGTTAGPIVGNKTMTGNRGMNAGEFTFNLYQTDENYSIEGLTPVQTTTNVAGAKNEKTNFAFNAIPYETAGTYYYVVTETKGTAGGVTYDERTYRVNVEVVDNLDGTMTATVNYVDGTVAFTNSYYAKPAKVVLGGYKTMHGRDMKADEFTFELYHSDKDGNKVLNRPTETVTNVAALDGVKTSFKFDAMTVAANEKLYFLIVEKTGTAGGVTYDTKEYIVEITFTDNLEGQTLHEITAIVDKEGNTYDEVHFHNYYSPAKAEVTISGIKTLNGRDMNANEFTFNLYQTDENYSIDGLQPIKTTTNVAGASGEETGFSFTNIPFEEAGAYFFVVTETKGSLGGVAYDERTYKVNVVVEDNLDGTLKTTVNYVDGPVAFINTYNVAPTNVTFDAEKQLYGREWKSLDEFTFELYEVTKSEDGKTVETLIQTVKATSDNRNPEFAPVEISAAGIYEYVVKESHAGETINGITYSVEEYTITVNAVDKGDGTLSVSYVVTNEADEVVAKPFFVNIYDAKGTRIILDGYKTMHGRDMDAEEFAFELYYVVYQDGNIVNKMLLETIKNVSALEGVATSFKFSPIGIAAPGKMYFEIVEKAGNPNIGVTYDTKKYLVEVTTTDNLEGQLVAAVTSIVDEDGKSYDKVHFHNYYSPAETQLTINGNKTLNGRDMKAEEFAFNLYQTDENYSIDGLKPIQTTTNVAGANGEETGFSFTNIPFETAGTYYFVVNEENGGNTIKGVTYDSAKYEIKVEVEDNLDGTMTAKVVTVNGSATNEVSFTNTYKADKGTSAAFEVEKELSGREWKDGDAFTFELYATGEDYKLAAGATPLQTITVTDEESHKFEAIPYAEVGTHYYVVKESHGGEIINGITYSTNEYQIKVVVVDNLDGTLTANYTYESNGKTVSKPSFENIYKADSVTTSLSGSKVLNGRDMDANEFTFHLYETDETFAISSDAVAYDTVKNEASANGVADAFEFKSITFDKAGTYYYAVVEEQKAIAGVTMDTTKYNVTIKVVDDTNGKLVVDEVLVNGKANNSIAFVNTYTIDPTPFEFGGNKTLTGRTLAANEFTFNLYESDVTFTNHTFVTSVKNDATGAFEFTGLEKAVGTYYYVVEEEQGTVGGVTYDTAHYHVTVKVVDNGIGGTSATVEKITKLTTNDEGTVVTDTNAITFVNKYVPVDKTGLVIGGNKVLTGRHTIDGEFTFELYETKSNYIIAEGAEPIRTVNEADTFEFKPVYFEKAGYYYFVVKELDKNAGGMTYDDSLFKVCVYVYDDGKGELHSNIITVNSSANLDITFNNTYTINDQEEFAISGTKEFTGRDWTEDDVFTFELYETNDTYEVSGAALLETKTATKGNVNFSFNKFVYKAEETHYYVVKEVAGATDNGITYDTKQYQIKVVVTDNHDGTLSMTSKTVVAGTEVTNIKFINTYEVFDNSAAYVDIEATKTLSGRPLKNAEFTFELYEATYDEAADTYTKGNLVETVKNANTAVKFNRIKYTEAGTYHYIVKEQVGDATVGITYDANEYPVTVVIYDDGNGRLAVDKTVNGEVGSITINNTYTVTPDTFELSGTKELTGRDMVAGEFEFSLYQATDSTYADRTFITSVKNNAAGAFTFTGLSEQPGTYYYVIEEQQGSKGGVTYDASHYHVVVTIVDNGKGTTEVSSIAYTKVVEEAGKTSTEVANAVTFKNTYTPTDSVGLVLGGNKALAGRHTIDGEFTFELYKTDADFELVEGVAPIQTVNEDDKFEFKPLTYSTTGTHYYVIKELDKNAGGMTYDTASYRITVEVTDDLNGELVAEVVSMTDANGKAVEEITFNNSYKIEKPVNVLVNGNKVLRGREWLDTDVFTFELYEANSNYEVAEGAEPVDTQTATKGNTAFVFDEFTYNAEATHYYVVKEVVGTLGGITYDTTVYNVKVVVTDNHDGTLSVEKTYAVDNSKVNAIEFVNTYEVLDSSKAYATIRGIKTLDGRALANGEFEFELYEAIYDEEIQEYVAGELKETVKNTATAFTFSTMEYSEVGTHYYVVKEKAGELGGITYDETIYVIEVKITDGYDGKLYSSVAIINSDATVVEFNNTYTIYPDKFSFEAVKTLTGREMNAGEFSFELYETNSSYENAKLVQTVTNDKNGKFEFTGLSKYPGTYYYVIKEVEGTKGGVSYDSSYYQVKIVIVDEGNGTTKIENTTITKVSISEDGAVSETADAVVFDNTYTAKDTDGIVIEGTKKLSGRHMINGEFAFELYDAEGTLKQTTVNKDGKFAFKELFFDEVGTYTYTVKEKDLAAGGMSYDSKEFEVVIKVTDDLNGELDATIVSINGSANTAVEFHNMYEIKEPNSTVIKGYKTFTGREWTENDVFTFELYEANSNYEVAEGAKPLDTQTATKGNTAFVFDEITYNAEDTHYYVVKEVAGDATVGITYDASVYNVKVEVVDLHDGTLSVAQTVSKANTVVEEIEFVNTYEVYEGAYALATISGIKTLTTRPIKDAEFTFDLYETGSDFAIVEGSTPIQTVNDGVTFTFETIKYEMIGTYYYVVKEMHAGETLNGVTYDAREHKVLVEVTDGGKGYLVSKVTVVGKEDNTLVVDNKYTITPTEFSLDVNKVLTGRDMNEQEFTFELFEAKDATFIDTTFVMSATNDAEGNVTFSGLAKQPGTYYYVISEKAGSKGGVTYDTAKYQVTVSVADDELGGTVVTNTSYVKVTADGAEKAENVVFNNTYEPKDTDGLVVAGIKVLTGRPLVNGEFVFELFDEAGKLLLQTTVNKDGKFKFAPLKYEEVGTHVYTIKERDNGIGGITYDPTVFKVTVEVEDDLNGELVAKVSEIKVSGSKVDAMIFENTYKAEPIKNVINGIKVLTGRDWLASDEFTFELYETESDFVISTEAIDTTTATKDNQEFAFDEITYDEQGEYYYVVKEVAGTIGGVTYDVRLYNVKVTVTDMLDGTFSLEQEVVVDDEVAEMIEFVNPYSAKETGLTLFAQKEIDGRDLVEKEFAFELYEANDKFVVNGSAIQTKENAADGKVVFDELTYEEVGTYYYVISEKAGTVGGVTYDETKYFVTVKVTDDLAGNLVAEIASITTDKAEAVEEVTFNNTYTPAQTVDGIVLTAKKIFNGRELTEGQFTFNLFETDKSFKVDAVALQTAKNDALGNVTFAEMNYDKAGTYYYVITEEIGNEENIIYDTARYMVEVKVTDDLQGQLHAEVVSITKEGEVAEEVVFVNTYFVNTADTTTANGWLMSMFASTLALIIAVSKKRKLSK